MVDMIIIGAYKTRYVIFVSNYSMNIDMKKREYHHMQRLHQLPLTHTNRPAPAKPDACVTLTTVMVRHDVPADVKQQLSMFLVQINNQRAAERKEFLAQDAESAEDVKDMATLMQENVSGQERRLLQAEAALVQLSFTSAAAQKMKDERIAELDERLSREMKVNLELAQEKERTEADRAKFYAQLQETKIQVTFFKLKVERMEDNSGLIVTSREDYAYKLHNEATWLMVVRTSPKSLVYNGNKIEIRAWGAFPDGLYLLNIMDDKAWRMYIPDLKINDTSLGPRIVSLFGAHQRVSEKLKVGPVRTIAVRSATDDSFVTLKLK